MREKIQNSFFKQTERQGLPGWRFRAKPAGRKGEINHPWLPRTGQAQRLHLELVGNGKAHPGMEERPRQRPEKSEGLTLLPVCCPPTPPLLRTLLTPSLPPCKCGCGLPHQGPWTCSLKPPEVGVQGLSAPALSCVAAARGSEQALVP